MPTCVHISSGHGVAKWWACTSLWRPARKSSMQIEGLTGKFHAFTSRPPYRCLSPPPSDHNEITSPSIAAASAHAQSRTHRDPLPPIFYNPLPPFDPHGPQRRTAHRVPPVGWGAPTIICARRALPWPPPWPPGPPLPPASRTLWLAARRRQRPALPSRRHRAPRIGRAAVGSSRHPPCPSS